VDVSSNILGKVSSDVLLSRHHFILYYWKEEGERRLFLEAA